MCPTFSLPLHNYITMRRMTYYLSMDLYSACTCVYYYSSYMCVGTSPTMNGAQDSRTNSGTVGGGVTGVLLIVIIVVIIVIMVVYLVIRRRRHVKESNRVQSMFDMDDMETLVMINFVTNACMYSVLTLLCCWLVIVLLTQLHIKWSAH